MRGVGTARRGAAALAVLLAGACGAGPEEWEATGVVQGVRAGEAQVVIEHGDIEGLMPAMTMSFDVADPALLEGLAPGQYVEFRLRKEGRAWVIVALDAPGPSSSGSAGADEDPLARPDDPAPDFALVDQDGNSVSLSALRGGPVLLDFIFTRCPGPCPVLTGIHVDVRGGLEAAQRARVRFVSITLDPAYDSPEVLADYAAARKIDTEGWSFLTGPVPLVEQVVRAYGVGSIRRGDGQIDHTVATFLIDGEGRIAKRYLGLRHEPEAIRADIEALL